MKTFRQGQMPFRYSLSIVAAATLFASFHTLSVHAADIPPGFYQLPDGRIMANTPQTAVAPPGYYLRKNGQLIKLDDSIDLSTPDQTTTLRDGEVPPGFHKTDDGRIMADDPRTSIAPPGYHIMDGMLMSNAAMSSGAGHHHGKGMWMFDYKYSHMVMKDMLDTTKKITAAQAVDPNGSYNYMMAPVDMTMDMHMFMIMYGITDKIMPMLMLHYMASDMGMLTSDGARSTMKSSGIADTVVSAMIQGPYHLNFNVGLSIPTGSIDVKGPMTHTAAAAPVTQKYGYGMQLGSGSYELKQGISYEDSFSAIGWGGGYEYTSRLNKNKHDYKLGDILLIDGWVNWDVVSFASVKGKLQFRNTGQIVGYDKEIHDANDMGDRTMSPVADETAYGGKRLDASASVAFKIPSPMMTLTLDFTKPVYQNLWGPQMSTSWIISAQLGLMLH